MHLLDARDRGCAHAANLPVIHAKDAAIAHQTAIIDGWPGVGGRLGELRMPVLVAAGLEDLVIPAANALALAEGIPQAWLARFPGSGTR